MSSPSSSSALNAIAQEEEEEVEIPPKEILDELLKTAIKASRAAGDLIFMNIGSEITHRKANSRDLLTTIDPLCERTIKDIVLEQFPDHDFLGEEDVPPGKEASAAALKAKLESSSDYLWIVDPIDGTSNFVHGMPLCMPSIAVAYKGNVVVGVIFDPHRDEVFAAQKGQGARLNGQPIQVSGEEESKLGDAIVAMGSPPAEESMEMSLRAIQLLMPRVRTIRMLGSAALMFAWVACGRLTCYWEYDLSSWDVSAGYLLVMEAGGSFTNIKGEPWDLTERKIVASNGLIHDEMLQTLEDSNVI